MGMSSYWQDEQEALHDAFVHGDMSEDEFAQKLFTFYPDPEEHSHALYIAQEERREEKLNNSQFGVGA